MTDYLKQATHQFIASCMESPRYRVAWLTGPPMSRKTALARQLCEQQAWQYLDYTCTPGYFDVLVDTISAYGPEQLTDDLQAWCRNCSAPVLVIDEIDSILAIWSSDQRIVWANRVSRLPYLPCGVLLVTHLLDCTALSRFLADNGQYSCLHLSGEVI